MCDASFLLPAELNDFREWKWKDPTERGGEGEREREATLISMHSVSIAEAFEAAAVA